jgi:UDP-glucose 4-epimerase
MLGGTGFIGSHVLDHLLAAGHKVSVVSRGAELFRAPLAGVTYVRADYRQTLALEPLLSDCDAVLHMVSSTVPGTGDRQPQVDVADNLIALIGWMQMMVARNVRRLIYLSSGGTVYGVPETVPIRESHPLRPINSYGIVKVAAESYIELFRRTQGLQPLVLRPSNPYGPRQGREGTQGLVNTLMHRAVTGEQVDIWGDGSVVRDYIHVHDLARLCVNTVESGVTGVFNAGSGVGTSVNDMIDFVETVTGKTLAKTFGPGRTVDTPVSVLDVGAAESELGWTPRVGLLDGLRTTWDWHLAQVQTK